MWFEGERLVRVLVAFIRQTSCDPPAKSLQNLGSRKNNFLKYSEKKKKKKEEEKEKKR